MSPRRTYRTFTHREAVLRISSDRYDAATAEVVRQRTILDSYISTHPTFLTSFVPLPHDSSAPPIVQRMMAAARLVGVGPMAGVAGAVAEFAARAAMHAGAQEAIVENGGDIYLSLARPAVIGLHTGTDALGDRLSFRVTPEQTPIAICSSSGHMGHSTSLGDCDLATVMSHDAALADAAATQAANLVKGVDDVEVVLNQIGAIEGVAGTLIVQDDRLGMIGNLPELIRMDA